MNAREWLRQKTKLANVVRIADTEPRREPADADVQRVAAAVTQALDERDPVPASVLGGVTVAQATANLMAVSTAMRRGYAMVACGCWPRYVGRCRCPDNTARLPDGQQ